MQTSQINFEKVLFDMNPDAVIGISQKREIITLNRAAEERFGVSKQSILGRSLSDLFENADDCDRLFDLGNLVDGEPDLAYMSIRPAKTQPFMGQVSLSPLFDGEQGFQGVLFIIRDVTRLLNRYSQLKALANNAVTKIHFSDTMLEKIPVCFVHINARGLVEHVSELYCALVGVDRSHIIGQPFFKYFSSEQKTLVRKHIETIGNDGPLRAYEQKYTRPDGSTRWYTWNILDILKDSQVEHVLAVGYDITDIHENQSSIAAQSAELQRKNEALGQFAAIVSHDLKAPLRHIAMFADMMNEDVTNQRYDELGVYAHHVRNSAVRMDRIIKSLLQYSQISYRIAAKTQFDPANIVINAIQNLETVVDDANADILVGKLPMLNGDPELIRHLIQNLISNAVKYRQPGVKPRIRIYATETETEVNLVVEDNGIGIDPKNASRIFGPFQRLHKDEKIYEGFGIGLALCKQIAESHDGSIELDTEFTGGARFVVHLPKSLEVAE